MASSRTTTTTTALPLELVLLIVDESARDDAMTGSRLALVSRVISHEVTRALYDVVCLRTWRSTRAFERLLKSAGGSRKRASGLAFVRHLSAPFMPEATVPSLVQHCPNLCSLQLLHAPSSASLARPLEVFVLAQYSGVLPNASAFARMHFSSPASLWHETQTDPTRVLTHFSMTHRLEEPSSGALATVRTVLAYPCLQVLVVRLSAVAKACDKLVERERDVRRTEIWGGLEALHDVRVRAGLHLIRAEQTQRQMVALWEAHVREAACVWVWGEQVWRGDE